MYLNDNQDTAVGSYKYKNIVNGNKKDKLPLIAF